MQHPKLSLFVLGYQLVNPRLVQCLCLFITQRCDVLLYGVIHTWVWLRECRLILFCVIKGVISCLQVEFCLLKVSSLCINNSPPCVLIVKLGSIRISFVQVLPCPVLCVGFHASHTLNVLLLLFASFCFLFSPDGCSIACRAVSLGLGLVGWPGEAVCSRYTSIYVTVEFKPRPSGRRQSCLGPLQG